MSKNNKTATEPFHVVYTVKKKAANRIAYRLMGFVFLAIVALQMYCLFAGIYKHYLIPALLSIFLGYYGVYLMKMSFRKQAYDITYTINEEGFHVKYRFGEKMYTYDDIEFVTMVIADENMIYYMLNVKTKKDTYPIPFTMQGKLCEKVYDFMNARVKHDDENEDSTEE